MFQYRVLNGETISSFEKSFNEMGALGWELVATRTVAGHTTQYIFMKEVDIDATKNRTKG